MSNDVVNLETGWRVDPTKCVACGDCVIYCPVKALKLVKKVATMADEASCCRESCRLCEFICLSDAIRAYV